jgi:hypothetical protein
MNSFSFDLIDWAFGFLILFDACIVCMLNGIFLYGTISLNPTLSRLFSGIMYIKGCDTGSNSFRARFRDRRMLMESQNENPGVGAIERSRRLVVDVGRRAAEAAEARKRGQPVIGTGDFGARHDCGCGSRERNSLCLIRCGLGRENDDDDDDGGDVDETGGWQDFRRLGASSYKMLPGAIWSQANSRTLKLMGFHRPLQL